MVSKKHPSDRKQRLINEEEKEKGRPPKDAREERKNRIRVKLLKEQTKEQETQDELRNAGH